MARAIQETVSPMPSERRAATTPTRVRRPRAAGALQISRR